MVFCTLINIINNNNKCITFLIPFTYLLLKYYMLTWGVIQIK